MENRGGKNDEVSGKVWKAVETSAGEVGIGETERGRSKGRKGGKEREEGKEEKPEEGEDGRS